MFWELHSHPHCNCFDPVLLSSAQIPLQSHPNTRQSPSNALEPLVSLPCSPCFSSELPFHQLPGCPGLHAPAKGQPAIGAAAYLPTLTPCLWSRTTLLFHPGTWQPPTQHTAGPRDSTKPGQLPSWPTSSSASPSSPSSNQRVILSNPNLILPLPCLKPSHDSPAPLGQK